MLSQVISNKFRFWSFVSMALLVFVHGYNLEIRYLQPWTLPGEVLNFTSFTEYFLANGVLRFRIPMLFVISGYLFAMHDQQPHRQRVRKRVRTLMVPYLLWSALYLLVFYVAETVLSVRSAISASHIAQIDAQRMLVHDYQWYELLIRWILVPLPYQFWFIRVLFFYNLAYPVLVRWISGGRSQKIFFSVAVLLWLGTVPFLFFEGEGLLFFSLGIWMQKTSFDIDTPPRWFRITWWVALFLGAAVLKTWLAFEGLLLLGNSVYPVISLLHKLVVFSGLMVAWFGTDKLVAWCMGQRWFVWTTSFSFIIYAVHAPLVAIAIDPVFAWMDHGAGHRMLTFIFLPLAIIALAVGMGAVMRRVFPAGYATLTGGRGL